MAIVTGEMLSPAKVEFTNLTFDRKTLRVVAKAESPEQWEVRDGRPP
jgi:hypothetical protein